VMGIHKNHHHTLTHNHIYIYIYRRFLWDSTQECEHRFQVIERSEPHLAAATAATALGMELDKLSASSSSGAGTAGGGNEVVGMLAGVLVDEQSSWKLLQHLHFHNLLTTPEVNLMPCLCVCVCACMSFSLSFHVLSTYVLLPHIKKKKKNAD
jgi:hypothetical protein